MLVPVCAVLPCNKTVPLNNELGHDGVRTTVGIRVAVGVSVGCGVRVGVLVGDGVRVRVGVRVVVGVTVGVEVRVGVGVRVGVAVGVGVTVGVPVGVGVCVTPCKGGGTATRTGSSDPEAATGGGTAGQITLDNIKTSKIRPATPNHVSISFLFISLPHPCLVYYTCPPFAIDFY